MGVAFSLAARNGKTLTTASGDKRVNLWDATSRQ
jgi:hypothetical protein